MWKPKEAIEYAGAGDAGDSDQPDVGAGTQNFWKSREYSQCLSLLSSLVISSL